jgi:hypothetical protein
MVAGETMSLMADHADAEELSEGHWPDLSGLVTEDDEPVDNLFSERQRPLLVVPLHETWEGPPPREDGAARPFLAASDVGVFNTPHEPAIAPDAFLAVDVRLPDDLGRPDGKSYFVWLYGKPPDVVIEIVGNRKGGELDRKLRRYEWMGVPYYVVFDRYHFLGTRRIHAFELRGGAYEAVGEPRFERLGLALAEWSGDYMGHHDDWLRWHRLDGSVVSTAAELHTVARQRAEAEHQRAEKEHEHAQEERQRAEEERQRAEEERQRADRLAARLRALGIDPDEV